MINEVIFSSGEGLERSICEDRLLSTGQMVALFTVGPVFDEHIGNLLFLSIAKHRQNAPFAKDTKLPSGWEIA